MRFILLVIVFFSSHRFLYSQNFRTLQRSSNPTSFPWKDIRTQFIELQPGVSINGGDRYEAEILPNWSGIDTVFSPISGHVFQRSNLPYTSIPIRGKIFGMADSVRVHVTNLETQQNFVVSIEVQGSTGLFSRDWALPPGDYFWDFAISNVPNSRNFQIERAGIGEVFLVWGHSFIQGPGIGEAAQDPRSRTIKKYYDNPEYNNNYFQNIPALPVTFEQITAQDLGPFSGSSWIFGRLADSLVKKLKMPVLIYSAAFGGSNIYQNKQNITNQPFGYPWFGEGVLQLQGFPYRPITATFQRYIPLTGLRAIWVHHGLNDQNNEVNGGNRLDFKSNFEFVIDHIRTNEAGGHPVPFFLAREDSQFEEINFQINQIISQKTQVWPGLDLRDEQWVGTWRDDQPGGEGRGHVIGTEGLNQYFRGWFQTLHPLNWTDYPPLLWQEP